MAVQLKQSTPSTVIESLRASRQANDTLERLCEGSLERRLAEVKRLVESGEWKYGPATHIATYPHHAVARTSDGSLIRVEWSIDRDSSKVQLDRSTIFESATPAPDLGDELFQTAIAAVDRILDEDYDALDGMIASMTEALETTGDLSRRLSTEITLRAIKRDAWWHNVVREHLGELVSAPDPRNSGADVISGSFDDLLSALRESAAEVSTALRELDKLDEGEDVADIASDIAGDITNAITAMMNVDSANPQELATVYESVLSVSDYLLSGAKYLNQIVERAQTTDHDHPTAKSTPTDRE